MPTLQRFLVLPTSQAELFALLTTPATLAQFSPLGMSLKLVEGPEVVHAGCAVTWQVKRWGLSHRIVVEATALERDSFVAWEQRQGPLKKMVHTQRFDKDTEGVRLEDCIAFEPPGGILGLTVTAAVVAKELLEGLAHRNELLERKFPKS
jgi:ligand-binding SRPBCC domain-containing protein